MKRSFDPAVLEMMDRPQPVSAELEHDLLRIRQLNRWFGSYRLLLSFMRRWIKPGACIRVVDLATGSGDIPRLIANYARKIGAQVEIDAVDRQPATLEIAGKLSTAYPEISYHQANVLEWNSAEAHDFVLCTLTLHHFSDEDAVRVLRRTDDTLRRAAFSRARIFVFRIARSRAACWLAQLWSQKISIRTASHLVGMKFQLH
jgi:2-polyprenyl-3-methyl-5-hydroxy-6-metoxy-1,4-benzoquinol methylase